MDVYRANPNIVYARIEHEKESGTYRSDDAGLSWRKMSDTNPRPMYFSQIRIDPTNDLRIYVLGVQIHISDDGGKTFIENGALHSDHHAMWINPKNSNHIIDGNDGGIGISYDKGATWEAVYNMDLGQFYHITYDMETPYNVCGGLQDNYTWCGPTAVRSRTGIANDQWFQIHGGDGFEAQIDPKNSRIIYAESQDGNISRIDKVSNERKSIRPLPARGEAPLRWNWNTPILMSPHDPATIYVGANKVFKSTDRGQSWTAISPDLTTATDRDGLPLMGVTGKETTIARNDGVQSYGNIVQLVESPKNAGVLYAGTDDGKVHMTKDGKTWTDITTRFPGVPEERLRVAADRVGARRQRRLRDLRQSSRRRHTAPTSTPASTAATTSARSARAFPKGHAVTAMAEDPTNPSVLYSGSEFGLFVSPDRGGKWTRIKSNLPTVPIHEIVIHPRDNDMIVATHGRSIWILDDITPLQQQAEAMKADAFLFDMRGGMQFNPANDRGFVSDKPFFGKNPTYGAAISYYLSKPQTNVALRIRDAAGTQVREITGNDLRDARGAGHQPHLLGPASSAAAAARRPAGRWWRRWRWRRRFGGGGNNGPNVLPGDYRVTLVVDGKDVAHQDAARHRRQGHADDRRRAQDVARHGAQPARDAARRQRGGRSGDHAGDAADRGRGADEVGGESAGGGEDRDRRRQHQARRSAPPARAQPAAGRRRWRRRLRRPAGQRPRPARTDEGPDHGIDLDADGAADAQQRRAARGPDQGRRRHQRTDRRDAGDLRRAWRIGREADGAQTGRPGPAGTLIGVRCDS